MPRVREKEPSSKSTRLGRPRKLSIDLPSEQSKPENHSTLLSYLRATNRIKETTTAQLYKARHLYITQGKSVQQVAEKLKIPVALVDRWVMAFDWEEKRDRLLFKRFRDLNTLRKERGEYIDDRHDRIASTVENTIERLLHDHHDPKKEFTLTCRDLAAIGKTLRDMQGVRRIIHDKPTDKTESHKTISLDTTDSFNNVAGAIANLFGDTPRLNAPHDKHTVRLLEDAKDAEFEVILDGSSTTEDATGY